MEPAAKVTPRRWPLMVGAGAAMLFPVAGTVIGIVARQMTILPGALVSLIFYGVTGYFAIQGRDWAKWVLFAFLLITALFALVFTFVSLGSGRAVVGFNPWVALVSLFYAGSAVLIALPVK